MRFVKASPQLTMRHPPQRLRRLQREQRSGSGRRAKRNHSLNVCVRAGRQSVAGFSPNGGRHRLRFNPRNPIPSPPPSSSQDAGRGPFLRPCDAHQCSYPIFLLTLYRLAACLAGDFHVEVDRLELGDGSRGHFLNLWPHILRGRLSWDIARSRTPSSTPRWPTSASETFGASDWIVRGAL